MRRYHGITEPSRHEMPYLRHAQAAPPLPWHVESFSNSPIHRVVCDYIVGTTDGYFLRCYP
jgi:dGTP triphosphohydrolase